MVSTEEGGEVTELDLEETGEILLSTLQSQFGPVAQGLRYRNPKTGNFRGISAQT